MSTRLTTARPKSIPLDQSASRKDEPHHQRNHGQMLSRRKPRPAQNPPADSLKSQQLRKAFKDLERFNPARIYLQNRDKRAETIQTKSKTSQDRTKHLDKTQNSSMLFHMSERNLDGVNYTIRDAGKNLI